MKAKNREVRQTPLFFSSAMRQSTSGWSVARIRRTSIRRDSLAAGNRSKDLPLNRINMGKKKIYWRSSLIYTSML